jgi:hypothetical protein
MPGSGLRTLIVRAATAALVLSLAGWPAVVHAEPRLIVRESVFDFGTVERGATVEHTFTLANAGDAELRIENVKSSCGCTVAVTSARAVPPRGEARVTVTLDTARMAGTKTKTVTVYTNDPGSPATGLTLAGRVVADLVLTPNPLYLGRLRHGESGRHEVTVTAGRPDAAYAVTAIEHASPAVHVRLEPLPDGPGQRIVVELDPVMPLGRFSEQLTLRTTSPREPIMTLAVFGSIEGDVAVTPPQVTFGVARGGQTPERELLIRNRGARPLAVTRVSVPSKLVTYRLREVEEGLEYRLTLKLRDGVPPGKVEGVVEIFTDHPGEDHIVVPVYAIVRDGRRRG